MDAKKIDVEDFAKALNMEILCYGKGEFTVTKADLHRPAIQLAGYFEHFAHDRVQLFGKQETGYMLSGTNENITSNLERYISSGIPAIIFTSGQNPPEILVEMATEHQIPVFMTRLSSTLAVRKISGYLNMRLAPEQLIHANLVEVFNVGIMIRGKSGLGKSELTLELIKRGHLMVADDALIIKKVSDNRIIGYAPETTKYLMEIRGLGIVNIRQIYGIASTLETKSVDIVMDMELFNFEEDYERLGFEEQTVELMGVNIPKFILPVHPSRDLAALVEITAMNHRLKNTGYSIEDEIRKRML